MSDKTCYNNYNSYDTINEAISACTLDSGCGGVYDGKCDGTGFSLCPTGIIYGISVDSCIHQKSYSPGIVNISDVKPK